MGVFAGGDEPLMLPDRKIIQNSVRLTDEGVEWTETSGGLKVSVVSNT